MVVDYVTSNNDINIFVAFEIIGITSSLSHRHTKVVRLNDFGVLPHGLKNMLCLLAGFSGHKLNVETAVVVTTVAKDAKYVIGTTVFASPIQSFDDSVDKQLMGIGSSLRIRYDVQNKREVVRNQLVILLELFVIWGNFGCDNFVETLDNLVFGT